MPKPEQAGQPAPPVVQSVQVGRVASLGPKGVPSGFVKRPVTEPVRVGLLGLEGDEQADLSVHGGPEKAVYGYAAGRYQEWIADFPEHAARFTPGAFGENLTIANLAEDDICVGDVHEIGTTFLQVCQPRQPCFKFALRFDDSRLPRAMVKSGRSGWYYRVLREGRIAPGDKLRLVDRPNPDLPFTTLVRVAYRGEAGPEDFARIARAAGAASWLRASARRSLGEFDLDP